MTIAAWRVVSRRFSESPYNPFDGEGAAAFGGRWNSKGVPVVYTSAARSLAILEKLVHADGELSALLDCVHFEVTIPDELIQTLNPADLPSGWNDPVAVPQLQVIGDQWARELKTPVLLVPSAVVSVEFNYILNPRHPEFLKLAIGERQALPIDSRLLKK